MTARRATLVLLGLLLSTTTAWADNLDRALVDAIEPLLQFCTEKKIRVVGVLKFRVGVGKEKPGYRIDPLGSNLADRIENLLVVGRDADGPDVIHATGAQAVARDERATQRTTAGRQALFRTRYALAWGERKESPDALLTGQLVFTSGLDRATLRLEAFLASQPGRAIPVLERTVETDRDMLVDAGLGFRVPLAQVKEASRATLDRLAIESAVRLRQEAGPSRGRSASKLLELGVLMDDRPVILRPHDVLGGVDVATVPADGKMAIRLRSLGITTIGIVLRMAGRSTINEQIDTAPWCQKWLLNGTKASKILGYYQTMEERTTILPFRREPAAVADSLTPWLHHVIDVQTLVTGTVKTGEIGMSLRGLAACERKRSPSWETLRRALLQRAGMRVTLSKKRAVLVPDRELLRGTPARIEDLPRPTLLEARRILLQTDHK